MIGRTRVSLELNSPHPPDVCALRLEAALAREAGRRAHGLSRQVAGMMRGHTFSIGYLSRAAVQGSPASDRDASARWVQGSIDGWGDAPGSRIRLESDRRPIWDRVEQFLLYLAWTAGFLLLFWAIRYLRSGELARAGGMLIAMSVPLLLAALYYRPSLIGRVAIDDRRLVSFVRAACDAELVEIVDIPAEARRRARARRSSVSPRRFDANALPRADGAESERIEVSIPSLPEAELGPGDASASPPRNWSRSLGGPSRRRGAESPSRPSPPDPRRRPSREPREPDAPDPGAGRRGRPAP